MIISSIIDIFIHLDKYLEVILQNYGPLAYVLIFLVIFLETGLVITPFLPGDSLLFAAGTFAALGFLNIAFLIVLLCFAAIAGDTLNYWIGRLIGKNAFQKGRSLINQKYLARTEQFYEKHGGKTIILARFIPIIRTFAPFVAGIAKMDYPKFLRYNIVGGILWVCFFVMAGYLFGNIPLVKENFGTVILIIIFSSIIPFIVEFLRNYRSKKD